MALKKTIADARAVNRAKGFHFFDRNAMRFFSSKVESQILFEKYFTTSEQFVREYPRTSEPRKYSIRSIDWETGNVDTWPDHNGFQAYDSKSEAKTALKILVASLTIKEKVA